MAEAESDDGGVKREDEESQAAADAAEAFPAEAAEAAEEDAGAWGGEREDDEEAEEGEVAAAAAASEEEEAPEEGAGEEAWPSSGDVAAEVADVPQPTVDDNEGEGGDATEGGAAEEGNEEENNNTNSRLEQVPDTGEIAEIVLITTSLGSIRRQFFSSQRTKNFLDCKGVVYIIVDSNRDTSTAKNLRDVELFKEWKENHILKATPETENSADPEIIIPQVLVDGVVVGSETTLQDLEEDNDLDWIFSRAACPNCLHEKSLSAVQCESCGVVFRSLIPPDYITEGHVVQMLQGCPYNEEDAAAAGGEHLQQQQRWGVSSQQSLAADVDFGDFGEEEEGENGEGGAARGEENAAAKALQAAVKAEAEAETLARKISQENAAAAAAATAEEEN